MLRGFLTAVLAGTLAGTAFPAIILAVAILGSGAPGAGDMQALLGIVTASVGFPFVLVSLSALLLGTPVTLLLRKLNAESEATYMTAGGVLGFVVPTVLILVIGGGSNAVSLLGACSGIITARTRWRGYREKVVEGDD